MEGGLEFQLTLTRYASFNPPASVDFSSYGRKIIRNPILIGVGNIAYFVIYCMVALLHFLDKV